MQSYLNHVSTHWARFDPKVMFIQGKQVHSFSWEIFLDRLKVFPKRNSRMLQIILCFEQLWLQQFWILKFVRACVHSSWPIRWPKVALEGKDWRGQRIVKLLYTFGKNNNKCALIFYWANQSMIFNVIPLDLFFFSRDLLLHFFKDKLTYCTQKRLGTPQLWVSPLNDVGFWAWRPKTRGRNSRSMQRNVSRCCAGDETQKSTHNSWPEVTLTENWANILF